jgi:heat shock protein HslJ
MVSRIALHASRVSSLLILALSLGCSQPPPQPNTATGAPEKGIAAEAQSTEVAPSELWGTSWALEDLAGSTVMKGAQPTLEFPEPGKVAGKGSCNRFFGAVRVSGETISFSAMASTRMACGEALGTQETTYLKALQDSERFQVQGDVLLIYAKDFDKPLRFKAKAS